MSDLELLRQQMQLHRELELIKTQLEELQANVINLSGHLGLELAAPLTMECKNPSSSAVLKLEVE